MSDSIVENITRLQANIPDHVRLIAVSKTHSVTKIRTAYNAGIRDFGENRLQEALAKQEALQDLTDIRWHFIGHLQSNKVKKAIAAQFDWIHTIDSLKLAQKLNDYVLDSPKPPRFCLQIKTMPDPNKFGWDIPQLLKQLPEICNCQHLKIEGLMTILPLGLDSTQTLHAFKKLHTLQQTLNQTDDFPWSLHELSMGMSGDYSLAIQAGATMIRVGQKIFGDRIVNI